MKVSGNAVARRARTSAQPEQLGLFKQRGGKRRGAGRKPIGLRAGSPHKPRPQLAARFPVHIVLRTATAVGNLRRRGVYLAIRRATQVAGRRADFRIVHLSIQRTHVHLLVEASHKTALAKGMQGFQVSAARHINAAIGDERSGARRQGAVFPDRYHAQIIMSPRQARHALMYVLANFRKHREDQDEKTRAWAIDWFSSACTFPGWTEYGARGVVCPPSYLPLCVRPPKTWLLSEGWKKHTPTISCRELPSASA